MRINSVDLAIQYQDIVLRIANPVEVFASASYSSILSLAAFILYHFPKVFPPKFDEPLPQDLLIDSQYAGDSLSLNPLYEPWCDYLTELVRTGLAYRNDGRIYFLIQSDSLEFLKQFKTKEKSDLFQMDFLQSDVKNLSPRKKIEEIFTIDSVSLTPGRKVAVVNFATSALRTDPFHPKVHLEGLIQGIWFNNEEWSIYNVLKGEVSTVEELADLDAVILTGSSLSVHDNIDFVNQFLDNLKTATQAAENLKILGICFGHQVLNKMFGGKVEKKIWIGGVQQVTFHHQQIEDLPFFRNIDKSKFELSEYHSDYVTEIPENFKVIASSDTCEVEGMISENKRFMSFQFHPEYMSNFVKAYENRLKNFNGQALFGNIEDSKNFTFEHNQSVNVIRGIIGNFLCC